MSHLARLAEAYGQGGQPGEGLTLVDEALAIGQRTGEQHHAAELQRLKGEILLQAGPRGCEAGDDPSPEAEACFQQALAIARQQQARSGTPRRYQPGAPVAAAGQAHRSLRAAGTGLRLVHRGV